jgi:hypothetical protein
LLLALEQLIQLQWVQVALVLGWLLVQTAVTLFFLQLLQLAVAVVAVRLVLMLVAVAQAEVAFKVQEDWVIKEVFLHLKALMVELVSLQMAAAVVVAAVQMVRLEKHLHQVLLAVLVRQVV